MLVERAAAGALPVGGRAIADQSRGAVREGAGGGLDDPNHVRSNQLIPCVVTVDRDHRAPRRERRRKRALPRGRPCAVCEQQHIARGQLVGERLGGERTGERQRL